MLHRKHFLSPSSLRGLFEQRKQEETKFAIKSQVRLLKSHQHSDHVSERLHKFFLKHTSTWFDARRVAIIGFGNVGLYIAALLLKDGYSVMVCDLNLDSRDIQQVMEAKLPEMLNSLLFGKHLQRYSTSDIRAILKRFSVATDLSELVRNGFKVVFECISEVLERKQHLFADLTELLYQRGVSPRDVVLCSSTQSLSIRSISQGAMAPYKSRLIGLNPSSQIFKVTYQGEEQPTIAFIRKLAHRIPVVALEETANNVKRARQLADETQVERHLQISCVKKINSNERNG